MVTIIDYGMGNLRSVQKAFERVKVPIKISSDIKEIMSSRKLVLPGVGNFEQGIYNLKEKGLFKTLNETVSEKKIPILGICLGMQLMTDFSEEGDVEGFGWIKGKTRKFSFESKELKIPHMGWNNITFRNNDRFYSGINQNDFFYFVHSYYVSCEDDFDTFSETNYGNNFVSSFRKAHIYGCQFHPEKSYQSGLTILKNFVNDIQ